MKRLNLKLRAQTALEVGKGRLVDSFCLEPFWTRQRCQFPTARSSRHPLFRPTTTTTTTFTLISIIYARPAATRPRGVRPATHAHAAARVHVDRVHVAVHDGPWRRSVARGPRAWPRILGFGVCAASHSFSASTFRTHLLL